MASNYIKQARARIRHAELALREEEYPYVVRRSQEAVELALKGVLRLVGIEPPKWHDVGPILREYSHLRSTILLCFVRAPSIF